MYAVGMYVTVASTANPGNQMYGIVTAYNGGTGAMTVNVIQATGSGTGAVWTVAVAGGPGQSQKLTNVSATVTANTTLATAYLYVPVAMTMFGQAVTLPAANTLATGGPQFIFDNSKGTYPFGIRDNTGALLMGVGAGGVVSVSLKDNSTVAGVWSVHGSNLEPGLVSVDTTLSSTYYGGSQDFASGVSLALSSNQSLHFVSNAARTAFYAYIVDNVGKQVTTPVLVASGLTNPARLGAVFSVSPTSAIVFYGDNTFSTNAVILSVSGTTITVGSPATIAGNSSTGLFWQEDGSSGPRIAQLSPTLYVVTSANYVSNGWTAVAAFSVSGASVTAGAVASIATSYGAATTVYALTATTALVIYTTGSAQPWSVSAVVVSVSGTTCTVGTPASPPATPYQSTTYSQQPGSCLLSPTTALMVTDGGGSNAQGIAYVCTVSGTTVTWGAQALFENFTSQGQLAFNNRFAPRLLPLSAMTAFLWYADSSSLSRSTVLTVSGSTVSAGAILYDAMSASPNSGAGYGSILPFSAAEFLAVKQRAGNAALSQTGGYSSFLQPSKISGSSVTTGYGKTLTEFGPTGIGNFFCSRLSGGDYVLGSQAPAAPLLAVFRNNGDAINPRGNISIPPLSLTPANGYFQQGAVASNRMVLIGSTAVSGGSSASGSQTRILSVEIAA
jgi:hypothetical protein